MRRLRDLMGLVLLAAMVLGGCETSSNQVRPPKPVEEYRDPPENDSRYSGYPQYPKETMDQDVLMKKAKDKANSTPNPLSGARGPGGPTGPTRY